MTYISTLGSNPRTIITHQENNTIDYGFACATKIPAGTPVKLLSTGLVAPVAALTDHIFGYVVVGNKAAGDKVTVQTPFSMIMVGEADGTVDEGNFVATSGMNTAGELPKFKVAVATNYVTGLAIKGGATTTEILVGILRTPYLMA